MSFIDFEHSLYFIEQSRIKNIKIEKKKIVDSIGFILAEDIISNEDLPILPTSAMDGYAIKFKDLDLKTLNISSINQAGVDNSKLILKDGEAIKTFTGSLMPKNSDTLIPIENVEVNEFNEIIITKNVDIGFAIREVGEIYKKDELLIKKGIKISCIEIGVLAELNISKVLVYKKPKIGIISTGSELLELGEKKTNNSQIRSSNHYILESLIREEGIIPIQYGCVEDDRSSIFNKMFEALKTNDVIVTTGGVSVGDYDFIEDIVIQLGFKILFHGVKIKPGQHILFGRKNNQFILSLPGFTYSATVTAFLYLIPLIKKLQNYAIELKLIEAILTEKFNRKSKDKTEFLPCNYTLEDGIYYIDFKNKKSGSSAILTNMLNKTALLVSYKEDEEKDINDKVLIYFFK